MAAHLSTAALRRRRSLCDAHPLACEQERMAGRDRPNCPGTSRVCLDNGRAGDCAAWPRAAEAAK
eukprot:6979306-Pyramimonas_sp.AAC.1